MTALVDSSPIDEQEEGMLQNGGFENGWQDLPPTASGVTNQQPDGWRLAWVARGGVLYDDAGATAGDADLREPRDRLLGATHAPGRASRDHQARPGPDLRSVAPRPQSWTRSDANSPVSVVICGPNSRNRSPTTPITPGSMLWLGCHDNF